jgi:hypothetical protein
MANNNLIMDIILLNSIVVGVGLGSIIGAIIYFATNPVEFFDKKCTLCYSKVLRKFVSWKRNSIGT